MFFDYLKLKWDFADCGVSLEDQERLFRWSQTGRVVQEVDTLSGEVFWTVPVRIRKRSDTHIVTVTISGSSCVVEGSPARLAVGGNNVFGSLDLQAASEGFFAIARDACREGPAFELPSLDTAKLLRLDITQNFALGDLSEVRAALGYLRQTDGGRFKVDGRRGETVYWLFGSAIRSGKAYAKGPHLGRQCEKEEATASPEQIALAQRILRLELTLGRTTFKRLRDGAQRSAVLQDPSICAAELKRVSYSAQWDINPRSHFEGFFNPLIGGVEVTTMNLKQTVIQAAATPGRGLAAYRTWQLIQAIGAPGTMASMPARTWYDHRKILFAAGLSWGDLSHRSVVPFRQRAIAANPVDSWADLRQAA